MQKKRQQRQQVQQQEISEPLLPNTRLISKYIDAMQTEINVSEHYKKLNTWVLIDLSRFHKEKPFANMKRDNIVIYINSIRKSNDKDPMHKWIGTYNMYLSCIIRFFKWLYNPTIDKKDRPKPKVA